MTLGSDPRDDPDYVWPHHYLKKVSGWTGVDLDGTLASDQNLERPDDIGPPIPKMLARVKRWLAEGRDVRIVTARVDGGNVALSMGDSSGELYLDVEAMRTKIQDWTEKHTGKRLTVTNKKDYGMIELWDDRAVQIIPNTGIRADGVE